MSTSIMIHSVTSVSAGPVHHSNANAVTLTIATPSEKYDITVFGLPTAKADALANALCPFNSRKSEDEIRADERRKIAGRIGLAA